MRSTNYESHFDGKTAAFLVKLAELCPRHLSHRDMDRLVREGQLRTLLSAFTDHHIMLDLLQVINGEAHTITYRPFRVESSGRTGKEWLDFFEGKVSDKAKEILLSDDFKPTNGVHYRLQLAPGRQLYSGARSPTSTRFGHSQKESLDTSLELSCLIREQMSEVDFRKYGFGRGVIGIHRRKPVDEHHTDRRHNWLIAKWPNERSDLALSATKVSHSHSLGDVGFIFCTGVVS